MTKRSDSTFGKCQLLFGFWLVKTWFSQCAVFGLKLKCSIQLWLDKCWSHWLQCNCGVCPVSPAKAPNPSRCLLRLVRPQWEQQGLQQGFFSCVVWNIWIHFEGLNEAFMLRTGWAELLKRTFRSTWTFDFDTLLLLSSSLLLSQP